MIDKKYIGNIDVNKKHIGNILLSRFSWIHKCLFWSDGTIINNKLKNLAGSQDNSPLLVDSHCLYMEIDDVITFGDLLGWSIISTYGTASIIIDGNDIKCIVAGTLFNMILNDGADNHYYPLAEGGYTIAYDTSDDPTNGTIDCVDLTWTTQDEFHKNIEGYNFRDSIINYENDNFIDSGDGVPVGWSDTYGNGGITTTDGIVRMTWQACMSNYYDLSIETDGVTEIDQDLRLVIQIRANKNMEVQFRNYGAGTMFEINATTEWQEFEENLPTSDSTKFRVLAGEVLINGDWFEIKYLKLSKIVTEHYVPKRDGASCDAIGDDITTLGNGYYIECETKLLFPDTPDYQSLDSYMEFLYDENGNQNKLSYTDLTDNVYNFDRCFCTKTTGRLTNIILIIPTSIARSNFIEFLKYLDSPNWYVYQPITKGAFVYWNLKTVNDADTTSFKTILNNKGISIIGRLTENPEGYPDEFKTFVNTFYKNGNYPYARLHTGHGNLSFELLDGEAAEFADEIISGDLIIVDAPDGETGGIAKVDWPNFVETGTLKTTTKENGGIKLDNDTLGASNSMLWIPAGQSGVPDEFEEKSLYRASNGDLMYYMWKVDDFFGVTFTNADEINVYEITQSDYKEEVSIAGLICVQKHLRTLYKDNGITRVCGFVETAIGDTMSSLIGSKASWDAGMIFGTNNGDLKFSDIFNNQNDPWFWCAEFSHHNVGDGTTFEDALNAIEDAALNNELIDSEFEDEWLMDEIKLNQLISKCDGEGCLLLSPVDLIKNLQFNDYNADDFWRI